MGAYRTYGPKSGATKMVQAGFGVSYMRDWYLAHHSDGTAMTNYSGQGPISFGQMVDNPLVETIGSFMGTVQPNPDGTSTWVVWNSTSVSSWGHGTWDGPNQL